MRLDGRLDNLQNEKETMVLITLRTIIHANLKKCGKVQALRNYREK
jgi:hypothetical protein